MKSAIYARSACDSMNSISIQNQLLHGREVATAKTWTVDAPNIFMDAGKSGTTVIDRPALQLLVAKAKKRPKEFGYVLVDNTARLARNLSTLLRIIDELHHSGVYVYFVSQELDSRQENFRQLLIGMMRELGRKVAR
jgi:DNA invertase Pin-like site-specific DNA recombinase